MGMEVKADENDSSDTEEDTEVVDRAGDSSRLLSSVSDVGDGGSCDSRRCRPRGRDEEDLANAASRRCCSAICTSSLRSASRARLRSLTRPDHVIAILSACPW